MNVSLKKGRKVMSGGNLNYVYSKLEDALSMPYGVSSGEIGKLATNRSYIKAMQQNVMEDKEVTELMCDVIILLKALEWYKSGDSSEEKYQKVLSSFKKKWLCRTDETKAEDCCKLLQAYADELKQEYFDMQANND